MQHRIIRTTGRVAKKLAAAARERYVGVSERETHVEAVLVGTGASRRWIIDIDPASGTPTSMQELPAGDDTWRRLDLAVTNVNGEPDVSKLRVPAPFFVANGKFTDFEHANSDKSGLNYPFRVVVYRKTAPEAPQNDPYGIGLPL